MPPFVQPVRWDDDALRAQRGRAELLFTEQRRDEGPRAFERVCASLRPRIEKVFDDSDDLRSLSGDVFRADPEAWQACRYLCGPPISQEDLWTMVGGPKFKTVPQALADETAEALSLVIDPVRFPWVAAGVKPSAEQREAALLATTVLWAAQQVGTERRGEAASRQEARTASALAVAGLELDPSRSPVAFLDDLRRGMYSRERRIAGSKCDVPARLPDGRLLALECKVSNGPKNGWKRVNREVGGKADAWRTHFGTNAVVGVVLAGVFDLSCLRSAQEAGVVLFWEHDLTPLVDFVRAAT